MNQRSYTKELLDGDRIPFEDLRKNLQELETINNLLGGHRITLSGFRSLLGNKKKISVYEVGCGGGDNLKAIAGWCRNNNVEANLYGIDIKPECIDYALNNVNGYTNINFITSDYRDLKIENKPDIIFSSLFCHHFRDEEIIDILKWKYENCTAGFFINDLHRHPVAYHSIKLLTRVFSGSYLVKNDAPLSVQRGFSNKDWLRIFREAGLKQTEIHWAWAFRWLITVRK